MNHQAKSENGILVEFPRESRASAQTHEQVAERQSAGWVQEEMPGVILRVQSDLFEHGRQRAIASGVLADAPEDVRVLTEHARAIAQEAHRDLFDPNQHTHDRLREEEYQKLRCDREQAELAEKHATATLAEREEEVAKAQPGPAPSKPSWVLKAIMTAGLTITIAPTLHDFIFVMSDDLIAWFLSFSFGVTLGALIMRMILDDVEAGGRRTLVNWVGVSAGFLMGVALYVLRISRAENDGDYYFAAAMTGVEMAIVLALEGIAVSHRKKRQSWTERQRAADEAAYRRDTARASLQDWRRRVKELNDAIDRHIVYVEERAVRHFGIKEIEAVSIGAVIDGYHAGISENSGRVRGIGRD